MSLELAGSITNPTPRTLTFLFTDIEGSTRRWEADRAAMAAALARHDALLREAIKGAGGTVFKTVGDAFCAVFADPVAALGAALAAQRALGAEDWSVYGRDGNGADGLDAAALPAFAPLRVRMALHTGEAEARDDDWFGPTVNRVARLLSAAHGGQVLVGGVAAELLTEAEATSAGSPSAPRFTTSADAAMGSAGPPGVSAMSGDGSAYLSVLDLPGCRLRDLGRHRLKDLGRPERVWQLLAEGLVAEFPPIRSLDTHPHNLPEQASSFVGREAELAELTALLGRQRLVTVVGVGGSGKTRLAQHAAAECLQRFPDGAWFVDLAPIAAPELVAEAVAAVLDPRDSAMVTDLMHGRESRGLGTAEAERAVAARLRGRRLLVILDNCEHLVAACAQMAAALARHAPGVTVLATSREPLRIPEETLWPIAPLGTADPAVVAQAADPAAELRRYDAARLFIDRARALQPDFAVTRANAPALAEICQRLDGIPLALELAAARVRLLGPAELARRLDDRFRLLVGGSRVALPRQQTLRAMIDWSYDLLSEVDKRVLCRLSVLAGPLPLAGALAVAANGDEIADADDALVADAAVGMAAATATNRVGGDGEAVPLDEMAAMDALDSLVEKSLLVAQPREDGTWFRLLDTIRVYAAEQLAAADGDGARVRLLNWLLDISRDYTDVRAGADMDGWSVKVAPLVPNIRDSVLRASRGGLPAAKAAAVAMRYWWIWASPAWRSESRQALARLRDQYVDDISAIDLAWLYYMEGDLCSIDEPTDGVAGYQEAARRFESLEDWVHISWAVQNEGNCYFNMGILEDAERCYRKALSMRRDYGVARPIEFAIALYNLAEVERARGNWAEAYDLIVEALDLLDERERASSAAIWPLHNLGQVLARQDRAKEAAVLLGRSLSLATVLGAPDAAASCLYGLGGLAAGRGDAPAAAGLMGAAATILNTEHLVLNLADGADRDWNLTRARAFLDEASWQAAWAKGQALTLGQAAAEGLALAETIAAQPEGGDLLADIRRLVDQTHD